MVFQGYLAHLTVFGTQGPSFFCSPILSHDTCLVVQKSCLSAYYHLHIPASKAFPGNSVIYPTGQNWIVELRWQQDVP